VITALGANGASHAGLRATNAPVTSWQSTGVSLCAMRGRSRGQGDCLLAAAEILALVACECSPSLALVIWLPLPLFFGAVCMFKGGRVPPTCSVQSLDSTRPHSVYRVCHFVQLKAKSMAAVASHCLE